MGFFLTDPFTHTSMAGLIEKRAENKTLNSEDFERTNANALTFCPNPNLQGYFPQHLDGTCPDHSYTMVNYAPCNCLCNFNYHPVEVVLDGGHVVIECHENANLGCMDEFNENYDSTATEHRHSDCGGCLEGYAINPSSGLCELIEDIPTWGCMDENAWYYDSTATEHQGPCGPCNPNYARPDVTAENVNEIIWCELDEGGGGTQPECVSDSSCEEGYKCVSGACVERIEGCTDPNSKEYDSAANTENGSCISCIEGYIKDDDGLCTNCDVGYKKNTANNCISEEEEGGGFNWMLAAVIAGVSVIALS